MEIDALLTVARALLYTEGASEIEDPLERASDLINETGAKSREPVLCELVAVRMRRRDDESARERHLREALRLYTEMGATGHAERVARELGL